MTVLHPIYNRHRVESDAVKPLQVAIFGAGPSGFYAAEELLKQTARIVTVDLFDRLPTPYGLVRGGVAPDHQKIKTVTRQFDKIAHRSGFRFFGNVSFGQSLMLSDVLHHYHYVLFATGMESDRRIGIPGEELPGSYPAATFVAWYNGHPDYHHLQFDFSRVEQVVIVGNGNVALDIARILTRAVDELSPSDIASHAVKALRQSGVKDIYILGRRGPAQAAFTNAELRELTEITGVDLVVRPEDLTLDALSQEFVAQPTAEPNSQRNLETLCRQMTKGAGSHPRKIHLHFLTSPVSVLGANRVEGVRVEKNVLSKDERGNLKARGTGVYEELPCQMVFRSIGYQGQPLIGVPFDDDTGTIPSSDGRVLDPVSGVPLPRLYVAGWIKRGPSGVIGTNKADANATVTAMLTDAQQGALPPHIVSDPEAIPRLLAHRQVPYVTFAGWQRTDQIELARGTQLGKARDKLTTIEELLKAADAA